MELSRRTTRIRIYTKKSYAAIEIAPTKIVGENPYSKLEQIKHYTLSVLNKYGLAVSSMQSIWYGKNEKMFASEEERHILLQYTQKAILFAEAIGCYNIVFGCPKNRIINNENDINIAIEFFGEIGNYAKEHNTTLALEANPAIYGTNFINTTQEAIDICRKIASVGIGVNFDFGTFIQNEESLNVCLDNLDVINHIHVSEPYLNLIKKRTVHKKLLDKLKQKGYKKFISIEMKEQKLPDLLKIIDYLWEIAK